MTKDFQELEERPNEYKDVMVDVVNEESTKTEKRSLRKCVSCLNCTAAVLGLIVLVIMISRWIHYDPEKKIADKKMWDSFNKKMNEDMKNSFDVLKEVQEHQREMEETRKRLEEMQRGYDEMKPVIDGYINRQKEAEEYLNERGH